MGESSFADDGTSSAKLDSPMPAPEPRKLPTLDLWEFDVANKRHEVVLETQSLGSTPCIKCESTSNMYRLHHEGEVST